MRKLYLSLFLSLLFILNTYANTFNNITIFGDSLSDNGNLKKYLLFIPKNPPYFEGHFSNGPNWTEYLYHDLFGGWNPQQLPYFAPSNYINFAVGGAGAVLSFHENLPYTITSEVTDYLYLHNYPNKEKTLYLISIGANNYLNLTSFDKKLATKVVSSMQYNIERLIDHGGKQFLIMDIPNIAIAPEIKEKGFAVQQAIYLQLHEHRKQLQAMYTHLVNKYKSSGVQFVYFDAYNSFNNVYNSPAQFGFSDIEKPCYDGGYISVRKTPLFMDEKTIQLIHAQNPSITAKSIKDVLANPMLATVYRAGIEATTAPNRNCQGFLFWDKVHPTTAAHRIVALYVEEALKQANMIPTP
jgi:phospholipase/lecithinase/hemolysin